MDGKTSTYALKLLLEGKLKNTKITGLRVSYRQIERNKIKLIFTLVDKDGRTLATYDDACLELREFDTLTICDIERMFDFKLSSA